MLFRLLIILLLPISLLAYSVNNINKPQMVLVKGGSFIMGDTFGDGLDFEKPIHKVKLTYDFYMGKYEVTQKEYKNLMGSNPSYFEGDNLPVEQVTWFDAIKYCNALSRKNNLPIAYNSIGKLLNSDIRKVKGYRLPTEAEWEYSARGGNFSKGYKYSGSNNIDEVAWYFNNSESKTHDVGLKKPNELGLYDMSGNVCEWCTDWQSNYTSSLAINPYIFRHDSYSILRGASWDITASGVNISFRYSDTHSNKFNFLGFRVARTK